MPGLETLTAIGTEVTIGGVVYRLAQLTRADWAEIHNRIKSGREDPIAIARRLAEGTPADVARAIYDRAYGDALKANVVPAGELDAWRLSLDGMCFQFYLQIRGHHEGMTEERAAELLEQYGQEYLNRILAELRDRFPEASIEDVAKAAMQQENDGISALVSSAAGLPAGNPGTPETPGTPTSHSTGNDGTQN